MERIFVSPEEAAQVLRLSRSRVFELLARGELASVRNGKRRLISRRSIEDWAAAQLAEAGFDSERRG